MLSRILYLALTLCWLAASAGAEPGVALLLDSRRPEQTDATARARRFLYLLHKQNALAIYQFSFKTVDFAARGESWQWQRDFKLTRGDLPALAFYNRQGNKVELRNLIRRYSSPQEAAESAFRCAQVDFPNLVTSTQVFTGVRLETIPAGAPVLEREVELGRTPLDVPLTPGRHELKIAHPDCLPVSQTVNLKTGDQPSLSLALTPAPARLVIESSGPPLEVTLDDQPAGTTPLTLDTVAGPHRFRATAPDSFELAGEIRAQPGVRTVALLSPTPRRVRVGWSGLRAEGYTHTYTAYRTVYPYSYYRRCGYRYRYDYSYQVPYLVTDTVVLSSAELNQRARERLQPSLSLVEPERASDCALKLAVQAVPGEVVGELQVLDASGAQVKTFTAQRDMPWLTFDTEGSARKRAGEVVEELAARALEWIGQNVQPSELTPEEQAAAVETRVEPY
ncbi:MAG: PEGA domain-containing protein [Candidatus Eremiobacterota bacterium]